MPDISVERTLNLDSKKFIILITRFSNGYFISVTEGSKHKLGSLNLSLASNVGINTVKIIPDKYNSTFLSMLSERFASQVNGICIVSLNARELDLREMKGIMKSIEEVLNNESK